MNAVQLLKNLGAMPTYIGYHYLLRAIQIVRDEPLALSAVKKEIYYVIADDFAVDAYTIESNIRVVLKRMWKHEQERMRELSDFRWEKRPSVSEFLCFVLMMPEGFHFSQ